MSDGEEDFLSSSSLPSPASSLSDFSYDSDSGNDGHWRGEADIVDDGEGNLNYDYGNGPNGRLLGSYSNVPVDDLGNTVTLVADDAVIPASTTCSRRGSPPRLRGILTNGTRVSPLRHRRVRSDYTVRPRRMSSTQYGAPSRSRSRRNGDPRMSRVPMSRDFLLFIGLCFTLACAVICLTRPAIFAMYEGPLF